MCYENSPTNPYTFIYSPFQSAYQIWDMNYFDGTELSSIVPHSHSLGSECTLFGCAAEDLIEYYAIHPAMCVIGECLIVLYVNCMHL